MRGVPSLKLGVPSFYISFEFWKVVHPSVKARCCPRSVILRAMPSDFLGGPFEIFEGHSIPSVKHNPICFFLQKLNLSL